MKIKHVLTLILMMSLPYLSSSVHAQGEVLNFSFTHNDSLRSYLLYVPEAYDGSEAWSLVINYHDFNWSADAHMDLTKMNSVADTGNFLIAYPQGLTVFNLVISQEGLGWNESGNLSVNDDVDFTNELIDEIVVSHNIDLERIYATGFGIGAGMTNKVQCDLADKIAAAASVSTPMTDLQLMTCMPERPVSFLFMAGTNDPFIPFDPAPQHPILTQGMQGSIDFWTEYNNCSTNPTETELNDSNTTDNSTVTLIEYNDCDLETELVIYRVNDGGHAWPGGGPLPGFFGTINQDINASVEIWNFFKRNSHPEIVSTSQVAFASQWNVYPNPTSHQLNIELDLDQSRQVQLKLMNILGQQFGIFSEILPAGSQHLNWSAFEASMPTGLYHLVLVLDGKRVAVEPVVLMQQE